MDERILSGAHPKGVRLTMVFLGVLGLVNAGLAALALLGVRLAPGAALTCMVQASFMFLALAALAARLRAAFPVLLGCWMGVVLGSLFGGSVGAEDPYIQEHMRGKSIGMAFNWVWIGLVVCGPAWAGREQLTRPWDLARLPGWIREGILGLFRPGAFPLVLAGVLVFLASLGVAVLLALSGVLGKAGAKLVALGLLAGGGLVASG
ncbi:MAG: hypothetical protein AB1758_31760, partial [Candidatus Eremiobacterota bacterium]